MSDNDALCGRCYNARQPTHPPALCISEINTLMPCCHRTYLPLDAAGRVCASLCGHRRQSGSGRRPHAPLATLLRSLHAAPAPGPQTLSQPKVLSPWPFLFLAPGGPDVPSPPPSPARCQMPLSLWSQSNTCPSAALLSRRDADWGQGNLMVPSRAAPRLPCLPSVAAVHPGPFQVSTEIA